MFDKVFNINDTARQNLLLWLLGAYKSIEVVRGLFRGSEAWFDQGVTLILFFLTYTLVGGREALTNKPARRVRIGLLVLLVLSLVWSTLRTTNSVVTNRMEHDRLTAFGKEMQKDEERRLRPVYESYLVTLEQLHCKAKHHDTMRCAAIRSDVHEIASFLITQPEQPQSSRALAAALRTRQAELRKILIKAHTLSTHLPEPVDPVVGKRYGYWEAIQWMRDHPTEIEVQAVMGSLFNHGLVLTIAMFLATVHDLKFGNMQSSIPPNPAPAGTTPQTGNAAPASKLATQAGGSTPGATPVPAQP